MKQLWCAVSLMAGILIYSSVAPAAPVQSGALLQQMKRASQSLSYELAYINVSRQGIESLRYRHAIIDSKVYAQLLQMDGPRREIVQRGNEVSYFESGLEPFTMQGDHIVDSLPSLIYADFAQLSRTMILSPSAARVLPINFVKSYALCRVTALATATSSGWTVKAGCLCASTCSIGTVKLLNSIVW